MVSGCSFCPCRSGRRTCRRRDRLVLEEFDVIRGLLFCTKWCVCVCGVDMLMERIIWVTFLGDETGWVCIRRRWMLSKDITGVFDWKHVVINEVYLRKFSNKYL